MLALAGLRWGELAGLQVSDRVSVPGPGLRLQRAVLASNGGGELFVDTLKNKRARTVPLVPTGPDRGPMGAGQGTGRVAVRGSARRSAAGVELEAFGRLARGHGGDRRPDFRVHDLRHTAASVWLAAGADPKVVQRVLGHATASMTMDLYGHLMDDNLWRAARLVGDISGTSEPPGPSDQSG